MKKYIIFTGGGSGGHIAPIRAIAPTLKEKGYTLKWVGSSQFEKRAAHSLNIPFISILSGKMRRGLTLKNIVRNFLDLFKVALAFFQSLFFLLEERPKLIFSTGGFVSVPLVVAAGVLRIPVVIHEQTIGFGLANKIALPFADRILLAFEDSKKHIPKKYWRKIEVVGNPVRSELLNGSREAFFEHFPQFREKEKPILYITGGGQGAKQINEVVFQLLSLLLNDFLVIHQAGEIGVEKAKTIAHSLDEELKDSYIPLGFIGEELPHIYATASFAVSRAGAGTVNEFHTFRIPTVFIPLRPTQDDEQMKNAQWFVERNSGSIIEPENLSKEELLAHIRKLSEYDEQELEPRKNETIIHILNHIL